MNNITNVAPSQASNFMLEDEFSPEHVVRFVRTAMGDMDRTSRVSAYEIGARATQVHNLADECSEKELGGKKFVETDQLWAAAAGDLWLEADRLRLAACDIPPRNMRDVCSHLSVAAKLTHDVICDGLQDDSEEGRTTALKNIEKLLVGALEICALTSGTAKEDVACNFMVNQATKLWNMELVVGAER